VDEGTASVAERAEHLPRDQRKKIIARLRGAERVNRAVAESLDQRQSDRFFLYVHYMDVHDHKLAQRSYAAAVKVVDGSVGDLLDSLEDTGLLEDAFVVLVSDHGEILHEEFPLPAGLHLGNPSFEPVLEIPLIVFPPLVRDTSRTIRTQDLRDLILDIAGYRGSAPADTDPDELFLSEMIWQTYRKGRWKSMQFRRRNDFYAHLKPYEPDKTDSPYLFDLLDDPEEQHDVSALHPEVVAAHGERIRKLGEELAERRVVDQELSAEDARRLRALGYLDE